MPRSRLVPVAAFLVAQLAAGCLSHRYTVPRQELARLAQIAPEARGRQVRVVQQLGTRRGDPLPATPAPPQPPAAPPSGEVLAPQGDVHTGVHIDLGVHGNVGGGSAAPPGAVGDSWRGRGAGGWQNGGTAAAPARAATAAPAAPSTAAPVAPAPRGRTPSGGWRTGGGGGGGGDEAAIVLAVVLVAVAALAVTGLAVTEGVRYDGTVSMSPHQLVHLRTPRGERPVPLWALTAADVAETSEAVVHDDEGFGLAHLGRAPLSRKGFAFKVEVGGMNNILDDYTVAGLASNLQLGYFPHQMIGILATATLSGAERPDGSLLAHHTFGGELQLYPIQLWRLHLGAYGNVGTSAVKAGTAFAGGLLAEVDLTTRLALTAHAGATRTNFEDGGRHTGFAATVGLAVY